MSKSVRTTTLLGSLSIGVWEARKVDKASARKVESDAKATTGTISAAKYLLAGVTELKAIKDYAADRRMWWSTVTVPWFDTGPRAYAAVKHADMLGEIGDSQRHFYELVDAFMPRYPVARAHREFEMGTLFDPNEFPHPDVVRRKFYFNFSYDPVPNSADIRIVEGLVDPDDLIKDIQKRERERVDGAMREAARKLYDVVSKMHKTMAVKIGEPGSTFRDSKLENILEIVEIMPGLNLTNDPELVKLTKEAKKLATRSPGELREDEDKRAAAAKEARALAQKLNGLFGGLDG